MVIISGDGFTPGNTRLIVGSYEYTSSANISYSQIRFVTDVPPQSYIDQSIPITVLVGTNPALCSASPCAYRWASRATPMLNSVSPSSITGAQTLTLSGQNLNPSGSLSLASVNVMINGRPCNATSATNSTIVCQIEALPAGNHSIVALIDGELGMPTNRGGLSRFSSRRWYRGLITNSYFEPCDFKHLSNIGR